MPTWSPEQYLKFEDERSRPCRDLVSRIALERVGCAIDLGCGPGNSTQIIANRWPHADLTGLDNSSGMIQKARKTLPDCRWITQDIVEWLDTETAGFDLVFSNAALHWVPDHATVYPTLLAHTARGGALAIQMPANLNAPAQRLMRELATSSSWSGRFQNTVRAWNNHDSAFYYDLIAAHCSSVDMWETEYIHVLPDAAAIVEWYKGSGLRPYLDALDSDSARDDFVAQYLDGIRKAYPAQKDGRVLLPFRRSFVIAYR